MLFLLFAAAIAARRHRKDRHSGGLGFQDILTLMQETEEEDTEAANWKAILQLLDGNTRESKEDRNLELAKKLVEENEKEEMAERPEWAKWKSTREEKIALQAHGNESSAGEGGEALPVKSTPRPKVEAKGHEKAQTKEGEKESKTVAPEKKPSEAGLGAAQQEKPAAKESQTRTGEKTPEPKVTQTQGKKGAAETASPMEAAEKKQGQKVTDVKQVVEGEKIVQTETEAKQPGREDATGRKQDETVAEEMKESEAVTGVKRSEAVGKEKKQREIQPGKDGKRQRDKTTERKGKAESETVQVGGRVQRKQQERRGRRRQIVRSEKRDTPSPELKALFQKVTEAEAIVREMAEGIVPKEKIDRAVKKRLAKLDVDTTHGSAASLSHKILVDVTKLSTYLKLVVMETVPKEDLVSVAVKHQ